MAGRSRSELEQIRATNRAALGMSGFCSAMDMPENAPEEVAKRIAARNALGPLTGKMASVVPGMGAFDPMSLMPQVRLVTAFPPLDVTYDPTQAVPPASAGPGYGDWLTRHVVRPEFYVGGTRVAPYENEIDWSGVAKVLAALAAAFGIGVSAWTTYRAFARSA